MLLKDHFKKKLKWGEVSQDFVDDLIEVNKMNLPWTKPDPNNPNKRIKVFKGGW